MIYQNNSFEHTNTGDGTYNLVDEKYLDKFNINHIEFMKGFYYSEYKKYCINQKINLLNKSNFFSNMRKKRVKIIQICCPYCGYVGIEIMNINLKDAEKLKYCSRCGKTSASENAFFQISRILRIIHFHSAGLEMIKSRHEMENLDIVTYDIYQLELVEISSILEVVLRDFFNAFLFIKYFDIKDEYLIKIIDRDTGNDFLNIDRANQHYKKALKINLREIISESNWKDLIDIVNMRNTFVHNNGIIDMKFKNTNTYLRLKDKINGDLLFLDDGKISYYLEIVCKVSEGISKLFEERYGSQKYNIIANHYFNLFKG